MPKEKVPQNAEHRCDAMNRENHSNAREEMEKILMAAA
jgi:hypothetical protein